MMAMLAHFEGQFYDKGGYQRLSKLGNLLVLKKKSLTHTHLTGVPNQSSGVQFHSGFASPTSKFRQEILDEIEK